MARPLKQTRLLRVCESKPMKHFPLLMLFVLLSVLPACAALPPLSPADRHQMDSEDKQGKDGAAEVAKATKPGTDTAQGDRVNRIGQKLAAAANSGPYAAQYGSDKTYPFTWRFFVIKDPDVNAFSLPGGYVYVNTGLLDKVRSDDELAGVLGHEITHAAHHHIQALSHAQSKMTSQMFIGLLAAVLARVPANDIANLAQGAGALQTAALNLHFSQAAERDADHGGTILMERAGYNPVGMLTFMERLEAIKRASPSIDYGIYQNHPDETQRVVLLSQELAQMKVAVTPRAVRLATGAARVVVRPAVNGASELDFAGQTLARLSDPQGTRASAAASRLNTLLDNGLQMYQVKASGATVLAADRTVLTLSPADAALSPSGSADALAAQASEVLRSGLWKQTFNGQTVISIMPVPGASVGPGQQRPRKQFSQIIPAGVDNGRRARVFFRAPPFGRTPETMNNGSNNIIFAQAKQTEGVGFSPRLSDTLALPAAGGVRPA